ncbi:MAG: hypothetical protein MUP70_17045, partial [Candidatus Aminicenantes bacterium]|nr:hypothetical protein [Candidatus Aminicenantes bacterium]
STKKERKDFIYLPEIIHKDHVTWIPPIYMDEKAFFDPKKNKSFTFCDTTILLAYKEGRLVGRCMGIINRRYNEAAEEKTARFSFLETYEDREVVNALVKRIEAWAREKGMTKIAGPHGFTDQDPEGFLIEGFEHRPALVTNSNFEWMPGYIEDLGYTKEVDYFVYKIDIPEELPEFYTKIHDRVLRKGKYTLVEFKTKKEIKPWIIPVLDLMNLCYTQSGIYGYTPLTEAEMKDFASKYMLILDPRFLKVVTCENEVVGFVVGVPDMTEGIKMARGRILPFGIFKILRAQKKTKMLQLFLGAIRPDQQGRGVDVLMGVAMLKSASKGGFEWIDTHHELETNVKVRGEMVRMGGQLYKKYRIYQKSL